MAHTLVHWVKKEMESPYPDPYVKTTVLLIEAANRRLADLDSELIKLEEEKRKYAGVSVPD